jgi:hypothetical protein
MMTHRRAAEENCRLSDAAEPHRNGRAQFTYFTDKAASESLSRSAVGNHQILIRLIWTWYGTKLLVYLFLCHTSLPQAPCQAHCADSHIS